MKPFCTIEVPDVETAAYLSALIWGAWPDREEFKYTTRARIEKLFPGGLEAAEEIGFGPNSGRNSIWVSLNVALRNAGVNREGTTAPWLKPKAPDTIGGEEIKYRGRDGIKVGCALVSLEQMELIIEKCKEVDK